MFSKLHTYRACGVSHKQIFIDSQLALNIKSIFWFITNASVSSLPHEIGQQVAI